MPVFCSVQITDGACFITNYNCILWFRFALLVHSNMIHFCLLTYVLRLCNKTMLDSFISFQRVFVFLSADLSRFSSDDHAVHKWRWFYFFSFHIYNFYYSFLPSSLPRTFRRCLMGRVIVDILAVLQSWGDIHSFTTRHNLCVCMCMCMCVYVCVCVCVRGLYPVKEVPSNPCLLRVFIMYILNFVKCSFCVFLI